MRRDRTAIGNVDSPLQAWVGATGTVAVPGRRWSLTWWVRASDRWHVPAEAGGTAVSQRLVDAAPVVETGLRVPGGQALHRAWCVVDGTGEWLVVEVEDRSREPIGVAVVVEGARRIGYRDRTLVVDGVPALVLPREPARFTSAPDDGGTVAWPGDVRSRAGSATVAAVFPVAHTATLRLAVPLTPGSTDVDVGALPGAKRVASGWQAHIQPLGSLRVELPDEGLAAAVAADRAALLVVRDELDAPTSDLAAALAALDRYGHHRAVAPVMAGLLHDLRARRWGGAGSALVAAAQHHRLTRTALEEDLVGPVAEAAHKLRRRAGGDAWTTLGQLAAAELLDGAGQPDAAERCRQLAAGGPAGPPAVGHEVAAAERLDRLHADLLLESDDGLAVLPGYRDDWLGQGVEVHDAPTRWGPVSFAVRWHGARPALLWQAESPVRLTAPLLDPSWSTDEPRGEALLAPVEPAGGLPKVVAPLGDGGTDASSAPEGGTFA